MSIPAIIPYQLSNKGIELRYALRSAAKHLSGLSDVYLIGDKPDWYTGKHVPFVQTRGNIIWKQRNIYEKVLAGIEASGAEEFLFMNDDHYLLATERASKFPNYRNGTLSQLRERVYGDYKQTVDNTIDRLRPDEFNFDVHCPMRIKANVITYLDHSTNWGRPHGYCFKTLYGSDLFKGVEYPDIKIRKEMNREELDKVLAHRKWFSTSDHTFNTAMIKLMNELYPEKSRWEK